jgi:thioredoxin:protein disulfide reductase
MKKTVLASLLMGMTGLLVGAPASADITSQLFAPSQGEFMSAAQAFAFTATQQSNGQVSISFDIAQGYHLYRHQFSFTANNVELSPVTLPPGVLHDDPYQGKQQLYSGLLKFVLDVNNVEPGATVIVKYQGCAGKALCYPPQRQVVTLNAG